MLVTLPLVLKRSVSGPRVGVLKFKKSERTWLMVFYFLFNFLVLGFVLVLGIINPTGDILVHWLTVNLFLMIGLIIAFVLGLVGWFIKFQRLYAYAVLIFIGFALAGRILSIGFVLTILGVLITASGIIVMRNFIQRHPKITLPEKSVEREK
jgi:hypothetical protein